MRDTIGPSKRRTRCSRLIPLVLCLLLLCSCAFAETQPRRTLQKGDRGADVYALKLRLYELGYFRTADMNDSFSEKTEERVKELQKLNGLRETGAATPELQELIFSDACVGKKKEEPVPEVESPVAEYLVTDEATEQEAEEDAEILIDKENGLWRYTAASLQIEITRHTDEELRIRWYECDIRASRKAPLKTALTVGKQSQGIRRSSPYHLVKNNHCVLAVSDDYYAFRLARKQRVGIIVRNGRILGDRTYGPSRKRFPTLETLAVFGDGSMKTYAPDAYSAQEYLDMGAANVFAFGPVLVRDGELGELARDPSYYHYKEPRIAIGMIEPYHYLIVAADGRIEKENIQGVYLDWLAKLMLERGCTEALNLDGGGTACLMFMGERLNKTGSSTRALGSIIYFGKNSLVK